MSADGVVPAAGFGTRWRPFTEFTAKPALPYLNRPLIHWTLDLMRRAGVGRTFVNLHHLPHTVRNAVASYGSGTEVIFSMEPDILGTAGLFIPLRDKIATDPFLVANPDAVADVDLKMLLEELDRHPRAWVCLGLRPLQGEEPYTPVDVSGGGAVRAIGSGPHMFTGFYAARRAFLDRIPEPGPRELVKDVLLDLVGEGRVRSRILRGGWNDLGTPDAYLACTLDALSRGASQPAPPGSRWVMPGGAACLLHESAGLSKGAAVTGPLVLGPRARIAEGATAGHAVLFEDANLEEGDVLEAGILSAQATWTSRG